jgi:putative endopeptidase
LRPRRFGGWRSTCTRPAEFRCNGVTCNIDAFYDAFGAGEDDALYPEPRCRERIWN